MGVWSNGQPAMNTLASQPPAPATPPRPGAPPPKIEFSPVLLNR